MGAPVGRTPCAATMEGKDIAPCHIRERFVVAAGGLCYNRPYER